MVKSQMAKPTKEEVWEYLSRIPDPEIPVITITELGVVRNVEVSDDNVIVTITPTYSGCPAMKAFEQDIISTLESKGLKNTQIKIVYTPVWTTDWINEEAKRKLKEYGIAPPEKTTADKRALFSDHLKVIPCPFCDSKNTELRSQFGSTACKALYFCNACQQPFEYFKCI